MNAYEGEHAEPLDGHADMDAWVAREDRYRGKHREATS